MLERHKNPDNVARFLTKLSATAISLPGGLYDNGNITYPVLAGDGSIGTFLPGKGILLHQDLKNLGINKKLPGVFERTFAYRLRDKLRDERGAITTYAQLLTAYATQKQGCRSAFYKSQTGTSNQWSSMIRTTTGSPSDVLTYTAIPGGAAYNQTDTGAYNYGWAAGQVGTDNAFLVSIGIAPVTTGFNMLALIDLLVVAGGIDANSSTPQTVNSTALTRYTGGEGVVAFFEITTTLGATPANITITKYTNQAGTTLRAAPAAAMVVSAIAPRIPTSDFKPFIGFQNGDYGMRSVEEVQLSAAMGAGVLAVGLCRPLIFIPTMPAGIAAKRDESSTITGAIQLAKTSGNILGYLTFLTQMQTTPTTIAGDLEMVVG